MKKNFWIKVGIILVAVIWSLWQLYPTYQVRHLSAKETKALRLSGKLSKLQGKTIKLGLDLQGGMYLVLEVDLQQLLLNLAKHKDAQFYKIMNEIEQKLEKDPNLDYFTVFQQVFNQYNLRLNKYFGKLTQNNEEVIKGLQKQADDAVNRSLEILRNRVDEFGVSEPNIQKRGNRRIVIELPGIQDIERAKELIGKTALLEFKLLKAPDVSKEVLKRIDEKLKEIQTAKGKAVLSPKTKKEAKKVAKIDTTGKNIVTQQDIFGTKQEITDTSTLADTSALEVNKSLFNEHPFLSLLRDFRGHGGEIAVPEQNKHAVEKILNMPQIKKVIPSDVEFLWGSKSVPVGDEKYYELYLVNREPELTGKYVVGAGVQIGSGSSFTSAGKPIVNLKMNSEGAKIFAHVTGANINRRMAIVLDNRVYSAPVIRSKIPNGDAIIEGMGNMDEAKDLAIILRAGALPAPVKIIEERTVGPSLGRDSIRQGTFSAILGFALVILFMIFYYRMSGFLADLALLLNMLFVMAVLAGFHFTLTLPGVAGIILTIGMAVDANVLIFERIREELRSGKTIRAAIDAGYGRAFITILDANLTTLFTAIVLYQFGTGPIRGFALTLSIGILSSMFTAIVVTRVVYDYITEHFALKKLSI
ncbi:preprotein translocase subunit SecD [bacterium BMS3Abin05]|nr:preprotein translocase subunit SecD [bacterium BMS3Abin05]GBE28922.1 preprotein translocase subunit SecD [bacterium BMS3Bbin03]